VPDFSRGARRRELADDGKHYAGHRRTSRRPVAAALGADEGNETDAQSAQVGRRSLGMSRQVQLFVILVVSVPASLLGVQLGMSTGDDSGDRGTGDDIHPVLMPPPSFSLPSIAPASTQTVAGSPSPTSAVAKAPAAPSRPLAPLVLDNFDGNPGWASLNDLGQSTGATGLASGGGKGVVGAGGLTLVYQNSGVFETDVRRDVSAYKYLVLRISGVAGGEQGEFMVSVGGIQRFLADFMLDGGGRPVVTMAYRDIRIPMTANGINAHSPGRLALSFGWGGSGTIVIDEIRFEGPDSLTIDDMNVGTGLNQVSYVGGWGGDQAANDQKGRYAGSNHYTNVSGSTATLTFVGSRVKLYTELAAWGGYASVIVDGRGGSTIDFYDAEWVPDYLVWDSGDLTYGRHTVALKVLGTSQPPATGVWVDIDRFDLS
jgi:hypothetical protein